MIKVLCLQAYGISFVPEFVMCFFDKAVRDISGDPLEKQLGDKRTSTLMKLSYMAIPRRLREMAIQGGCKHIQSVVYELYFNNRNLYHNTWFESFSYTYNAEFSNLIFGLQDKLWPNYAKQTFGSKVEGTDGALRIKGSIKEFLDFQLHKNDDSGVEGDFRKKHLSIDTPIG